MDELNNLTSLLTQTLETITEKTPKTEIEDSLLDLLIMAYVFGTKDVSESLKEEIKPDTDKMKESVYKKIAGQTWEERIRDSVTKEDIERIFVTESHRCFSDGQWDSADGRATHKTWVTMDDEKVRDTHWYIDNLTVKIDEYFYTLDGDRALRPYGFEIASNNINCRCYLKYSRRK